MKNQNYYNEFEPKAAASLRQLIVDGLLPSGEVDTRSIIDVKPADLKGFTQCHFFAGIGGWSRALELAGWPANRPVWTGSCPCQPFSAAGKQKGGADDRDLWPVWFDLIRQCRPPSIYGEQVASAISHGWLDRVRFNVETEDYTLAAAVLPACGVGAPHRRDRLWFVAHADTSGLRHESGGGSGKNGPYQRIDQHISSRDVGHSEGQRPGRRQDDENRGRRQCSSSDSSEGNIPMEHTESERGRQGHQIGGGSAGGSGERQESEPFISSCGDVVDSQRIGGCSGNDQWQHAGNVNTSGETRSSGFWAEREWIICGDGKARCIPAVESGIRILAHGVSERVGLLRAGGNAIVPQVAARFIRATMPEGGKF